jgi:hypothetical protein
MNVSFLFFFIIIIDVLFNILIYHRLELVFLK